MNLPETWNLGKPLSLSIEDHLKGELRYRRALSGRRISLGAMAVAFGTSLFAVSTPPASAQLARPQSAIQSSGNIDLATKVQFRVAAAGMGVIADGAVATAGGAVDTMAAGIGLGLGLATGALIGGALASPYYDSPYY